MPAAKPCPTPGCPSLTQGGRCPNCRRDADRARGTATQRGYNSRGHRGFRAEVLSRDPVCVLCRVRLSTVADHWPASRRDLEDSGRNPNDPRHGRGLCAGCHNAETARNQPGGWNA